MRIFAVGSSKNIGYFASLRLLESGATVVYLLRSPSGFDKDTVIQPFVKSGKAILVKGDATSKEDVANAWEVATSGGQSVDYVLFTLGATTASMSMSGVVIHPPNLVTQGFMNVISTIPSTIEPPRIVAITSTGATAHSHNILPFGQKAFYSWLLKHPHEDKLGVERLCAHIKGEEWVDREVAANVLAESDWVQKVPAFGSMKGKVLVVRPAWLTDGECKGNGKRGYKVNDESGSKGGGYTISRKDVAHFIVEDGMKNWEKHSDHPVGLSY